MTRARGMRGSALVAVFALLFVLGLLVTQAWANPEEACKKWPNNKQCQTTSETTPSTTETTPTETTPSTPTTTTTETTPTDTMPTTPTTTEPSPILPGGGTTGGTPITPTSDLPQTGAAIWWWLLAASCLITLGCLMLWSAHSQRRKDEAMREYYQ